MKQWLQAASGEVAWRPLFRSILALSPAIALFFASGNSVWLTTTALVGICATIVEERIVLKPLGVLLHGVAIIGGYLALVAASASPPVFAALCATLAAASIALTAGGHMLRSLGNFTFIPALYLASDTIEAAPLRPLAQAAHDLVYMIAGLLPVVVLAASRRRPRGVPLPASPVGRRTLLHLSHIANYGERRRVAEACVAVACAVGLAAVLVRWQSVDHGQWVIWSAASVVTGESGTEGRKLRHRATGALIGVPVGIAAGWMLPHTAPIYGASAVASMLTLIAFRSYAFGFGARCAFIALALTVGGHSPFIAGERIVNVIAGGLIGIACVFAVRKLAGIRGKQTAA